MPPHGRRRFSNLYIILSCLFIFASTASAAQAVLGIDLGTEYIKAALVKPGVPLDIVLTKDSKRKETAALAFKSLKTSVNTAVDENFPERIYGGDAVALSARFPGNVFPNLKPLLGLDFEDKIVSEYQSLHPELQLVKARDSNTVGIKSNSFVSEEEAFRVEELLAMQLKNVKANAETMAGNSYAIKDVVITVPSFYTVEERRAVTTAAELAGLRVLSVMSDGLAVGLNYATSRTFPVVSEGGKPEIHLVYDMGAGSTTATVLKFQGKVVKDIGKYNKTIQEVQVLGTSWDRTLGGDQLNTLIVDDMVNSMIETKFLKNLGTTSTEIKGHGRTMSKLWKEAERLRQVLSANTESSITMEGLFNEDFTFKYKLKRSDFEQFASSFAAKITSPIEKVLETAKVSIADVESIILHGGAVRTPFVQKALESAAKSAEKVRTNVNSDEAAVFGAAFKAASISPSFRVKEIRVSDSAAYPVFMSWTSDGKEKQQKLFIPTSLAGAVKSVSFKTSEDFSFDLFQQTPLPQRDLPVSSINTVNLTDSVKQLTKLGCEESAISNRFGVRISPTDGLPEVVSASVSCEIIETKKSGGVVDGMKDLFGFGSKKEAQEPLKAEIESEESSSSSVSSATSSTTTEGETSTMASSAPSSITSAEPKEPKKRVETINISFTTTRTGSVGIKSDLLSGITARLSAFDASDRARVLREEALNTLEGYTYKIRDILDDEGFIEASTPAQRAEIEEKSNDASSWIYGDGAEASQAALKERLDELRKLVKPITTRKEEKVKRPDALKKLQDSLSQATSMIELIQNQIKDQVESESKKSASMSSASAEAEASGSSTTETSTQSEDSSSSSPVADKSASSDDFAELDDDPTSSSSATTSSATQSSTPEPEPVLPKYSQADLDSLSVKQVEIKAWFEEQSALQEKLGPTDDPVLFSKDLSSKAKELDDAVMDMIMRNMKMPKSDYGSSSKKAKSSSKKRSKTSKTKTSKTNIYDDVEELTIDVAKAAGATPVPDDASGSPPPANGAADEASVKAEQGAWEPVPTDAADKDPFAEFEGMEGIKKFSKEDIEKLMKEGEQVEAAQKASEEDASSADSGDEKVKKASSSSSSAKGKRKTKTGAKVKSKSKSKSKAKATGKKSKGSSSSTTDGGHGEL